jgi:WD40 repeat protein
MPRSMGVILGLLIIVSTTGAQQVNVQDLEVMTIQNVSRIQQIEVLDIAAHRLQFHPTEPILFSCTWQTSVTEYDLNATSIDISNLVANTHIHFPGACPISLNAEGTLLAAANADSYPYYYESQGLIWHLEDMSTPQELPQLLNVTDVAFSPLGNFITYGRKETSDVRLFDMNSETEIGQIQVNSSIPPFISFSPKGTYIIGSNVACNVAVWDVNSVITHFQSENPEGLSLANSGYLPIPTMAFPVDNEPSCASGIEFLPNEEKFVITSTDGMDGSFRVRDSITLDVIFSVTAHQGPLYASEIHPDGTILATAGCAVVPRPHFECPATEIKLWDLTTGSELITLQTEHEGKIFDIKFSSDGRILASGNGMIATGYTANITTDSTIRLWGVETVQ